MHKRSEFYATRVFEKCSWEGIYLKSHSFIKQEISGDPHVPYMLPISFIQSWKASREENCQSLRPLVSGDGKTVANFFFFNWQEKFEFFQL